MDARQGTPQQGWVLYDNACGFCSRWVPFWAQTLRSRGFDIAPLQSAWVRDRLRLPDELLNRELRLLLIDGSHIEGADVYRHIMRRIWWAYPIYLLASTPGLHAVFNATYRAFANNRFRISNACRLSAPSQSAG